MNLIKRFSINFDLPPKDRFKEAAQFYKVQILEIINLIIAQDKDERTEEEEEGKEEEEEDLGAEGGLMDGKDTNPDIKEEKIKKVESKRAEKGEIDDEGDEVDCSSNELTNAVKRMLNNEMGEMGREFVLEMEGISEVLQVDFHYVCLLHLHYELESGCTSFITNHPLTKTPYLSRTLDWPLPLLRVITIEVDLMKSGLIIGKATTFAGFAGLLTMVKRNSFAIAVNYREEVNTSKEEEVLVPAISLPVSFLLRSLLISCSSYEAACSLSSSQPIMKGTFLIMIGILPHQGCIITRNELGEERRKEFKKGENILCQGNLDHWIKDKRLDETYSIDRVNDTLKRYKYVSRSFSLGFEGEEKVKKDKKKRSSVISYSLPQQLFFSLSGDNTWDEETIYCSVMAAKEEEFMLETLIDKLPFDEFAKGEKKDCNVS